MGTLSIGRRGRAVEIGDVCVPTTVFGQEDERTLKLEGRVTQLFDELRRPVYRYLVCLNIRPAEADEIIQETFLRLYRHLHAGGREDNVRGWVFRVAHNIGINELKRKKFLTESTPEQWAAFEAKSSDSTPSPEDLLLRKERMANIHAAICTLSPQQRECLFLRVEGFRYREIADILDVTVSTVAESLRRAMKKLTRASHG